MEPQQGYLAHKKTPLPGTLQYAHALGPMVVLGGGAVSYERGILVGVWVDTRSIKIRAMRGFSVAKGGGRTAEEYGKGHVEGVLSHVCASFHGEATWRGPDRTF